MVEHSQILNGTKIEILLHNLKVHFVYFQMVHRKRKFCSAGGGGHGCFFLIACAIPFSVAVVTWTRVQLAFVVELFIQNSESVIAT